MPEFSQYTLGLVRQALEELLPDSALTPYDLRQVWKQTLFDSGFPEVFTDMASSSYTFNWTEIIPDLFTGKFGDKNSHFGSTLPSYLSEVVVKRLVLLAIARSRNAGLTKEINKSLERDGFDISSLASELQSVPKESNPDAIKRQTTPGELKHNGANAIEIFISHSSEDKPIAAALTELLKNALGLAPQAIRCTSVDSHRLSVGVKTDETLKRELLNAKSFIALLTERSLNSTWVLFELGARWGADRHLAPVFAAGLTAERLRGPLSGISGLSCGSEQQIHQLVGDIAEVLGVETRKPHFYSSYVSELMKASADAKDRRSL